MTLPRSYNFLLLPRLAALGALACCLVAGDTAADPAPSARQAPPPTARFAIPPDQIPPSLYRSAVEHADPVARYDLARRLESGLGMPLNAEAAVRLYRLSADQGYAPAQYALGRMLRTGTGIERDEAEAVRRFQQAAAQGHAESRRTLAETPDQPRLDVDPRRAAAGARPPPVRVPSASAKAPTRSPIGSALARPFSQADCRDIRGRDPATVTHAYTLCQRAASGDANSLYRLGLLYVSGTGVPRDDVFGMRALRLAADRGHEPARALLAQLPSRSTASKLPAATGGARPPDGVDPGPEPQR